MHVNGPMWQPSLKYEAMFVLTSLVLINDFLTLNANEVSWTETRYEWDDVFDLATTS